MKSVMNLLLPLATLLMIASAAMGAADPGQTAPTFTLSDTDGHEHSLAKYLADGKTVVLEWFNPDCPFIVKHHQKHQTMNEAFAKVKDHGVVWLAINSNAEGKQGSGLERNRKAVKEYEMMFPVLMDSDGSVGRLYAAKTTPHMFIVTPDGKVAYNGAIDDNPSPYELGETNHVLQALHDLMQKTDVKMSSSKPYGCSVKY